MNKIGEINLDKQIKLMDAFDFVEQFSALEISNIKEGLWLAFTTDEDCELPMFYVVNNSYFKNIEDMVGDYWKRNDEVVSIEKGVIGLYNNNWKTKNIKDYIEGLEKTIASDYQNGIENQYLVCSTPYGNDGYFAFETVFSGGEIVAIRIILENL